MVKIREVAQMINDFIDTWQKNSAIIVTLFGDKDTQDIKPVIDFIKGVFGK